MSAAFDLKKACIASLSPPHVLRGRVGVGDLLQHSAFSVQRSIPTSSLPLPGSTSLTTGLSTRGGKRQARNGGGEP
jgi:hypothetical protein